MSLCKYDGFSMASPSALLRRTLDTPQFGLGLLVLALVLLELRVEVAYDGQV